MTDGYQRHSKARAAERYGLELDRQEYAQLSARIGLHELTGSPDCVLLSRVALGREKWALWYKGEWVPVVFDPGQSRIVTVLPKRELRAKAGKLPW